MLRWPLSSKMTVVWLVSVCWTLAVVLCLRQIGMQGWPVYAIGMTTNVLSNVAGYFALIRGLHR